MLEHEKYENTSMATWLILYLYNHTQKSLNIIANWSLNTDFYLIQCWESAHKIVNPM